MTSHRAKFVFLVAFSVAVFAGYFLISREAKAPDFSDLGETMKVMVYFGNSNLDPEVSCNKVFSVEREVPKTVETARAALLELLTGPTEAEKIQGFFTSINFGVNIVGLAIENGVARVEFDARLEEAVGGSCRVSSIRAEITETLMQFPTVREVVISVDGRTEDVLQP